MGIRVYVLKSKSIGDCTRGGVSSKYDELVVVNVDGPSDAKPDNSDAVVLESHMPGVVRLRPVITTDAPIMFGGNFAHTCDSRFTRAVEKLTGARFYGAVAIHDREEG